MVFGLSWSSLKSALVQLSLLAILLFYKIPVVDDDPASKMPVGHPEGGDAVDAWTGGGGHAHSSDHAPNYVFNVDWHDPSADVKRKFSLTFYPQDNSVEMFDLKQRRLFLSRIHCDTVELKDFFLGNTVVVFSRRLLITEYGNAATKQQLEHRREVTFAMIKPDGMPHLGRMIRMIEESGFTIGRAKMTRLTNQQAAEFYREHQDRSFFSDLLSYMTSGPVVALELFHSDTGAVGRWRSLLGPTDSAQAREEAPDSIRANFGKDKTNNAAHGSDSNEAANKELSFFFPGSGSGSGPLHGPEPSARLSGDTACCVIKPHALKSGLAGRIIDDIQQQGFLVTGLLSFHLKYEHTEEFYEIYKGVVQDYTGMVKQLSSGRSLVLEIGSADVGAGLEQLVSQFRQLVGPSDPELARTLRPESLRARYSGKNKDENAVHCTDLAEDGPLEVEYFFKVLAEK